MIKNDSSTAENFLEMKIHIFKKTLIMQVKVRNTLYLLILDL